MSKRKNRYVTDLKYESKRSLKSAKGKLEQIAAKWGDVDMFIGGEIDQLIGKIDEIVEEIHGIDPKTH